MDKEDKKYIDLGLLGCDEEDDSVLTESKQDEQNFINWVGDGELARRFILLKNRFKSPENDFYYWIKSKTPYELKRFLNDFEKVINDKQHKKQEIEDGVKFIGEEKGYKVYHITNKAAAQKYGKGTRWCISASRSQNKWYDYSGSFYFLISENKKYALTFDEETTEQMDSIYFIADKKGITNCNFELWNDADELDFSALDELPLNLIPGIKYKKIDIPNNFLIYKRSNQIEINPYASGEIIIPEGVELLSPYDYSSVPIKKVTSIKFPSTVRFLVYHDFDSSRFPSLSTIYLRKTLRKLSVNSCLYFARQIKTIYFEGTEKEFNSTLDVPVSRWPEYNIKTQVVYNYKFLTEASRTTLLSKSKSADKYANGKGSRWTQKSKCSVASTVKDYNKIDMNTFWKNDKLTFGVKVAGESGDYIVTISFDHILDKIQRKIHDNKQLLEFKCIYDALIQAINTGDVKISCTCLHPNTKIKLLDGTTPTVAEMKNRFDKGEKLYVYSTDSQGDFKPGEVEKVWITKTTKDFIKIILDNGKEIITTPEHPYMLRDGKYISAEDLKVGQSLMPMYFNNSNGYETIKLNSEVRGWHTTYKLVANYFKKQDIQEAITRVKPDDNMNYSIAIHHKDFNKKNNNPENLQIMTAKEHWTYHANLCGKNRPVTERMIQAGRENAIKRNLNPTEKMIESRKKWQEKGKLRNYDLDRKEQQSKILTNNLNNYYAKFTEEDWKNKSESSSIQTKENWKLGKFDTEKFHEARLREGRKLFNDPNHQLKMQKSKMKKVLQYLLDNNFELNEENYNKYRKKASKVEKVFNSFNDMIQEFKLNHKIVKIEKIILEDTPVYDIKVKKWENFVVDAGVVLHNCPDYQYRIKYWNSESGDEAGTKETRKADITNPNNSKGPACKHILAVLNNVEWLNKVASVINNYANYCKDNMEYNYSKYIFPKLYGMDYKKAVQMTLDDYDEEGNVKGDLKSDEELINLSNALGKVRGRIKKGSNRNPAAKKKEEEK